MRRVVITIGEPRPRRTEPFPEDLRRLRDGAKAMALPEPTSPSEMETQLLILHTGIAALQSMDDLGSDAANEAAHRDMLTLLDRYQRFKTTLKARA